MAHAPPAATPDAPGPAADLRGPLPGARAALVLLVAINLFNYIDRQILAAVEEPISKEFGVKTEDMGFLATVFLVSYMVASPLFGWLADRTSRWLIVGIGVTLWSFASGGSGLTTTYVALLLTRCLIGIGEAAYGPVAPTLISDLYPVAVRGKVLAWFYVAIPVGSALGYVVGGLFIHHWHWAFYVTLPPGLILGLWCFFMKEPPRGQADATVTHRASAREYKVLLGIRSYVLNTLAMTAMTFAIGGVAFWMPRYLSQERGVEMQSARLLFGVVTVVAGLAATLAGGWAGDKLRGKIRGSYFVVSAAGMLVGTPFFLLMLVTPFPACWVVLFLAVFCLFFNTGPSNTALANATPPAIRATAFAVNIFVIHAFGDVASPYILGWIGRRHSFGLGFALVAGLVAIGGLLWVWAARYPRRVHAPRPHAPGRRRATGVPGRAAAAQGVGDDAPCHFGRPPARPPVMEGSVRRPGCAGGRPGRGGTGFVPAPLARAPRDLRRTGRRSPPRTRAPAAPFTPFARSTRMRHLIALFALGLFGLGLAGCRVEGEVDPDGNANAGDTSYKKTTVVEPDGDRRVTVEEKK